MDTLLALVTLVVIINTVTIARFGIRLYVVERHLETHHDR